MKTLRVSSDILKQIDDAIRAGKKIQAIKILRSATDSGLREAKQAIDRRTGRPYSDEAMDIKSLVSIKSVTVDMGEGTVELSLDELNMMTLVGMQKIGIDETRRVLDLHDMLLNWEKGIIGLVEEKRCATCGEKEEE
jgi:hypothetical protein